MKVTLATLCLLTTILPSVPAADRSPREALQAFNDLIGSWRAIGIPEGGPRNSFWRETMAWEWQFKGDDAWLKVVFDNGKYFRAGTLTYQPAAGKYRLVLTTPAKETQTFEGTLTDKKLDLQRIDPKKNESQRLVFTLLHENRFLYRYEVKTPARPLWAKVYQVGCTKEGVDFAGPGDTRPECIVSGGLGRIPVTYKGKTYYVCCGGCRDAFQENPEKYVKAKRKRE